MTLHWGQQGARRRGRHLTEFNDRVVREFRANAARVDTEGFGMKVRTI
jgi:hypothetical protein